MNKPIFKNSDIYNEMLEALIEDCKKDYLQQIDNPMIGSSAKYRKHKEIIEKATGLSIEEVLNDI